MKTIALILVLASDETTRIYSTDAVGNRQYDKPSFTAIKDGKVYETDSVGNRKYDGQSYQIQENKTYKTDEIGNRKY